jgi:hypothetical protein
LFAGFEELRVKGIHAFLFTPTFLKDLFKIFRGFYASFQEFVNPFSSTSGERAHKEPCKDIRVFLSGSVKLKPFTKLGPMRVSTRSCFS